MKLYLTLFASITFGFMSFAFSNEELLSRFFVNQTFDAII